MLERIPARPGQVTRSSRSAHYLLTHSHRGQFRVIDQPLVRRKQRLSLKPTLTCRECENSTQNRHKNEANPEAPAPLILCLNVAHKQLSSCQHTETKSIFTWHAP